MDSLSWVMVIKFVSAKIMYFPFACYKIHGSTVHSSLSSYSYGEETSDNWEQSAIVAEFVQSWHRQKKWWMFSPECSFGVVPNFSLHIFGLYLFRFLSKNWISSNTVTHLLYWWVTQGRVCFPFTLWKSSNCKPPDTVYAENELNFYSPLQYSIELDWQQNFQLQRSQNLSE